MTPAARYAVVHQDRWLVVVDKAPGVLTVSHPGATGRCLLDDLRRDGLAVAPVHRLDKETSGLLVLALDRSVRAALEDLFRGREVRKEYLALVAGVPPQRRAVIDLPILDLGKSARVDRRGRPARTAYEVLESYRGRASLVRLRPETGRHNQIRVHLAHIGHPLLGDRKFGRGRDAALPPAPRTLLHAARLAFTHPGTGEPLDLSRDPPEDFESVRAALAQPAR